MTAPGCRGNDPYAAYDVRLDGDPASCQAAAALLRRCCARLPGPGAQPTDLSAVAAAVAQLAAALDRYGMELRRAQHHHARASEEARGGAFGRERDRNAALALAARARRRLRLACADILPEGGYRSPP